MYDRFTVRPYIDLLKIRKFIKVVLFLILKRIKITVFVK